MLTDKVKNHAYSEHRIVVLMEDVLNGVRGSAWRDAIALAVGRTLGLPIGYISVNPHASSWSAGAITVSCYPHGYLTAEIPSRISLWIRSWDRLTDQEKPLCVPPAPFTLSLSGLARY